MKSSFFMLLNNIMLSKNIRLPLKLTTKKQLRLCFYKGVIILLSFFSLSSMAETLDENVSEIRTQWAHVNYQLKDDSQTEGFKLLLNRIEELTHTFPGSAQSWIWSGIVKSSYAGNTGGLEALSFAKSAKKDLEKSIKIDPHALNGSAFMSLGTLYYKLPSWPISFGNAKKAEFFLKKAIEINPQGKEPNYFYGEFLYDENKYEQAQHYLQIAQNIPPRVDSAVADEFRQIEIAQMLAKVEKKLNK